MEAVVLIQCITGSKLAQQQGANLVKIWPPDTSGPFGYSQTKFDTPFDKHLTVTGIIDGSIDGCVQLHAPIGAGSDGICTSHTRYDDSAFD